MRLNILAFAVGACWLQTWAELPGSGASAGAGGTGIVLLAAFAAGRSPTPAWLRLLGIVGALALGFAWAAWRAELRLADALAVDWEGRDVTVVGVVAELPQEFTQGQRFAFDVEAVETPGASAPGRVMLSWYRGERDDEWYEGGTIRPGERWRLTLRLKRPHGNANPHGFDYEGWLLEQGVRATGYVRSMPRGERLADFVPRPAYAVERLRDRLRDDFRQTLPGRDYVGILIALAIGDQRAIDNGLWTVFSRTGTTHLMSISGLHVTMVAALAAACLGWAWRRSPRAMERLPAQRAAVAAGWAAALAYVLLSGFSVPAQRTLWMLSMAALALWTGRSASPSRTLAAALLVVLVIDPWAGLAPGFWLSFGAVAVLFYVGSARLGGAGGWRAGMAAWSAAQWAVTIGTLPLLLFLFQQFSLVSPLANAMAIPLVSFIVTPLALLGAVLPFPWMLSLGHAVLAGLMAFLEWLAALPLAVWQQAAPPAAVTAAALGGTGWLLLPSGFPARWAGIALLLPALCWQAPRPEVGEAWVDVLDVGQGLAVVVRTAGHALLYDAGPLYSAESDAGQRIVAPYLRAIGVDRLNGLMITHQDTDHSGGIGSVLAALTSDWIASSLPRDHPLRQAPFPQRRCLAGDAWEWDGVRFAVLHPTVADYAGEARKTNDLSCVLRIAAGDRSFLLTSDIEASDETALVARSGAGLRSDVVLVPHHGSRTSSTPAFIAAVGAADAVIPVGYRSRFGHPKAEVVAAWAATGARLWRTDRDGAVTVRLGSRIDIDAWRAVHRRYWHGR